MTTVLPRRIAILGNSGSGKSTLARSLARDGAISTLDLDTIFWEPNQIAVPRLGAAARADLHAFCEGNGKWIIEGCYGSLIVSALRYQPELVLVDPGIEACLENCRNRPWEPHKYSSKAEQDAKLSFLLAWVADYYGRDGDMSAKVHRALFNRYEGHKRLLATPPEISSASWRIGSARAASTKTQAPCWSKNAGTNFR